MRGPVLLTVLLLGISGGAANLCSYRTFLDSYFAATTNLYCFDGGLIQIVDGVSKLCSSADALQTPRYDSMDVLCADGFTLVGYSQYPCESGVLSAAIVDDVSLSPYSNCVADADVAATVCAAVDTADETSKLVVSQSYGGPVGNVDAVSAVDDATILYPLECGAGYGFSADISGAVVGYCAVNADTSAKSLAIAAGASADGCYALCPADPTSALEVIANLDLINIAAASRSGATVAAEVDCAAGFSVAHGAPAEYEFVCAGDLRGVANSGVYSCGEACPACVAACPANPAVADIVNGAELLNIASVEIAEGSASGSTVQGSVTCEDGFALESGAENVFDFQCATNEATVEANSGLYTVVNDIPVCHAVCAADAFDEVDDVKSIINGDSAVEGGTVTSTVVCDDGFEHEHDEDDDFEYVCRSGKFVCEGERCPECHAKCAIPASEVFVFYDRFSEEVLAAGTTVQKGKDTVAVSCKDSALNLVGPQYTGCGREGEFEFLESEEEEEEEADDNANDNANDDNADDNANDNANDDNADNNTNDNASDDTTNEETDGGNIVVPDKKRRRRDSDEQPEEKSIPFCVDGPICEPPSVVNGAVDKLENVQGGDSYTISCDPAHWFDTETARTYGGESLSKESFSDIEVPCEGAALPEFVCYYGCLAPDFSGGVTFPDVKESGGAPFEMGAKVTFSCLDDSDIEGDAEATCEPGGIPSPVCGACSFAASLLALLSSLLISLL